MLAELAALSLAFAPPAELQTQPARVPVPKWRAPVPDEAKTSTGLRVAVLPRPDLPLVHLTVVAQVGTELDPDAQPGLASALGLLMEEGGAGALAGPELIAALDALGGELIVYTQRSYTFFSVTVLAKHLERALQLIADVVARPKLDATAWERVRAQRIAEVIARRDEPTLAGDDVFLRTLLEDAPHAHSGLGTEASLKSITAEQLKAFWAERYGPKTVAVFVDGQTTAPQLKALAESAFNGFDGKAAPPKVAPPKAVAKPRWVLVDRPGSPQTTIRAGHVGIARTSPDFPAAALSNTVLGGSFTSRLVQNLREAHGYTYGAYSTFSLMRGGGLFIVRTDIRTDVTGLALAELLKEVKGMVAPLTDGEAGKGRALVTAGIVEGLSQGQGDQVFSELLALDVPLDALSKLPDQLDAASGEALAAAQKRLYRPEELTVVLIGDQKLIEPQLKKAVPGVTFEHLDLEGKTLP